MSSHFLGIASIVVAGQGFLLMFVILSIGKNRPLANYLLAALIGVVATRMLVFHLLTLGVSRPTVLGSLSQAFFFGGPLLYLYTRAVIDADFHCRAGHLLHILPALLSIAATPWLYGAHAFASGYPVEIDTITQYTHTLHKLIATGYFAGYALMAMLLLPSARTQRMRVPDAEPPALRWLRELLLLSLLAALAVAGWCLYVLHDLHAGQRVSESVEFLGNTLLFYLIATAGIRHYLQAGTRSAAAPPVAPVEPAAPGDTNTAKPAETLKTRYDRTSLSEKRARELWQTVTQHMQTHEPYLDSELSLAELAAAVDSYPRELSQVLNTVGNQSFYDFVNGYRAAKARELIRSDKRGTAMVDIALAAGFTGRSTLYKYFTKCFAVTPSQLRKTQNLA